MEAFLRAIGHRPPLESREQIAAFVGEQRRVLVDVVSCHWWQLTGNSTIAFSKDMNLFVMYPDVKTIIKKTRGLQFFRFVKRDILAIERIRMRDATHLTFIQAISQVKEPDGTKLGWQRAKRVLGNYHPDRPIESFQYQVERNGAQHALITREFTEHLTAVNLNLENGPILLDEEWRDACRDRAKENHVQGWNGLPGIRYKKKRRFKRPEEIADGDGFIFHKTKQTSYLRQTQFALLPKFPDLCLSRNQFYLLKIPEQLPVEAAVPDERTSAVDEPAAEIFHFQVENANEPDEDQLVATHDPFKSDLFNETNAMGPRYLPSPKSIITIPNANLAKSIDRVISNQMRLGRLDLEPFSTDEFKTVIRNRVSMFVKGMQTSILNICLLWKTVLSRKPKFNLGLIPIIEPTYPDIPRKNALLNLMAAISRGNIRGWEKEFEYLSQLAQRDPPRRSIFERNMGFRVEDQENLSDAIHIYRFFHECRLLIFESFKEVRLPDITSQAKRQATVKVHTAFTNILCKLRQFRATFTIQPARDVQEFGNLPAAAQLLLLNNDEPVNRRWKMVPQFKSNIPICMVEFSSFRFLTNPIGENMPEGVPDAMQELRRMFRKPTNSTFDTNRKGQLFEILMGQRLVMQGGISESRGSLETDGRNAWYWYETRKKAPVSAVYSESHPLIISRLKAYDFGSLLARRNNPRGMTMEERLDVRDLNFLKERNDNPEEEIKITFTGIDTGERYPIAFASIKPNHTVAFAAYPATSYWGPITAETNYVNMIKPEVVLNAEAEMSEVGRLLDFPQHHETLQTFYNSLKVLKSRQRRLKFMTRFFSSVFERMVTAAGASTHMRADEYIQENKAFIFAFEINSSFSTRREKKGRPSIHLKLERYLIQKLRSLGHLVVGIDGFNTSKACPICYRRLVYLKNCRRRVNQCLHCDNQIFHRDVASGQLIASLAKRKFNGEQYPQQFNRPDRPPAPPATQPPPANPLDLLPIPEAPADPDPAQVDQEDGNPDRPSVPPAAAPPANPMDLLPIPDAPPAISQVQVDQEEGHPQNPQNEPDPDFDQARQAHQATIQTLCCKRKVQFIDNEFPKKPMLVHSKWL